jgi:hypothetical protein
MTTTTQKKNDEPRALSLPAAQKALEDARAAYAAEPSRERWARVEGAQTRVAQALLVADATRAADEQRASREAADRRAAMEAELHQLRSSITRGALVAEHDDVHERVLAITSAYIELLRELDRIDQLTAQRVAQVRHLEVELHGAPQTGPLAVPPSIFLRTAALDAVTAELKRTEPESLHRTSALRGAL